MRTRIKCNVRQTIIPSADVQLKTTAKIGATAALRINALVTTASGPANKRASAGLQNNFALDVTSSLKSPNHGAMRNHAPHIGINAAAMRGMTMEGLGDPAPSPCVENPINVTMARVMMSPRMRMFLFFMVRICRGWVYPCPGRP